MIKVISYYVARADEKSDITDELVRGSRYKQIELNVELADRNELNQLRKRLEEKHRQDVFFVFEEK